MIQVPFLFDYLKKSQHYHILCTQAFEAPQRLIPGDFYPQHKLLFHTYISKKDKSKELTWRFDFIKRIKVEKNISNFKVANLKKK